MCSVNTDGATVQSGEPDIAGGGSGASVWAKWTAPRAGTLRITYVAPSRPALSPHAPYFLRTGIRPPPPAPPRLLSFVAPRT